MIDNTKTIKDRDPNSLIYWSKNKDGSSKCCNTFDLIDFFNINEKNKKRHCSYGFNYCECDFEKVINESNDPHLMRMFLVATNIVDETFFHLLNHHCFVRVQIIFQTIRYHMYTILSLYHYSWMQYLVYIASLLLLHLLEILHQ